MDNHSEVTVNDVYRDVEEIKRVVYDLSITKQDKIRPSIIITFLIFMFTQTVGAVWWASQITQEVSNIGSKLNEDISEIKETIEIAGRDRFYGKDWEAAERLFNLKFEIMENRIKDIGDIVDDIKNLSKDHEKSINNLQAIQKQCVSKFDLPGYRENNVSD